ncbi:hypothetical protein Bbelb_403870 [Branchiostoma belcheri]|nr:hypothetical protein Bbelb_403870 [Branchiostoma belcheri]
MEEVDDLADGTNRLPSGKARYSEVNAFVTWSCPTAAFQLLLSVIPIIQVHAPETDRNEWVEFHPQARNYCTEDVKAHWKDCKRTDAADWDLVIIMLHCGSTLGHTAIGNVALGGCLIDGVTSPSERTDTSSHTVPERDSDLHLPP